MSTSHDSSLSETILPVPVQLTKSFTGLAIDFGASVLKFIYRRKNAGDKAASTEENLRFVSCYRTQLPEALELLKENADIRDPPGSGKTDTVPSICTTGVGCTQFGKTICQALNVRLEQVSEFESFAKAFHYMTSHVAGREFLEPFEVEAVTEPLEQVKSQIPAWMKMIEKALKTSRMNVPSMSAVNPASLLQALELSVTRPPVSTEDDHLPLVEADPQLFPCLLVMTGSSHVFVKIEQCGSFQMVDNSTRGGRALFGIGCLLTDCTTFDELIGLAEAGDARQIDQYTSDVNSSDNAADDDDSSYIVMAEELKRPLLLFSFGKTVLTRRDEFKREDLSRAWLEYCILDLVQTTIDVGMRLGLKRVFFCGSICIFPLVRTLIRREYVRRSLMHMMLTQTTEIPQMDIIKAGSHLGALGCVIRDSERHIN